MIVERLVLYTSENCGLCDHAKKALIQLELSFDEVLVPDDHLYRLRTPVLELDGAVVDEGEITLASLRGALKGKLKL